MQPMHFFHFNVSWLRGLALQIQNVRGYVMLGSWCRGAMFWVIMMQLKYMFSWNKNGKIKIHSTSVYLFFHITLLFFYFPLLFSIWKYSYYGDSDNTLLIELTSTAQHEYILLGNTGDSCHDYFIDVLSPMYYLLTNEVCTGQFKPI